MVLSLITAERKWIPYLRIPISHISKSIPPLVFSLLKEPKDCFSCFNKAEEIFMHYSIYNVNKENTIFNLFKDDDDDDSDEIDKDPSPGLRLSNRKRKTHANDSMNSDDSEDN
jgi:hypothetical protein